VFLRTQNAVSDMTVQKEDVAALERDRFFSDDVRNFPRVDIHKFHVVVGVFREVNEARMQPQVELLIFEQFLFVDDEAVRDGIVFPLYGALSLQNCPLFLRKLAEFFDDALIHDFILARFLEKVKSGQQKKKNKSLFCLFFVV